MFIKDDFLLTNKTAEDLFHNHGGDLPVIDYHNHLSPKDIAEDRIFNNLSEAWLNGDHYKWRLMRANGAEESNITGDAPDFDKFRTFAETLPYAIGNPVYHWSHLELLRYFDINEVLSVDSADRIWENASSQISTKEFSCRNLLRKMKVEALCTTDDPADSLAYHKQLKDENFEIKVLPTFRPDKALDISTGKKFREYIEILGESAEAGATTYDHFLLALSKRVSYFSEMGCKISDHSFSSIPDTDFGYKEIRNIFDKVLGGKEASLEEADKFKVAVMKELGSLYANFGWTMQIHLGAQRNNSTRLFKKYGPDAGSDSIGDERQAAGLSRFLDALDRENKLPATVLYNLNPNHNELLASMAGNFGGCMTGKMQYGAAWWFLDSKAGIEKHLATVSNFGLLGRFIGMLTDSRSFLSFPRHEYFRRILANYLGNLAESGEVAMDIKLLSQTFSNISYHNAKNYFNF